MPHEVVSDVIGEVWQETAEFAGRRWGWKGTIAVIALPLMILGGVIGWFAWFS